MARAKRKGEPALSPRGGRTPRKLGRKMRRFYDAWERAASPKAKRRLGDRYITLHQRFDVEPADPRPVFNAGFGGGRGVSKADAAPRAVAQVGHRSGMSATAGLFTLATFGGSLFRRKAV